MVPPGSWSPAGTAAKPKTVPPVSSDRRQPGATRQSGGANWCHPPVRHAGSSPADSAWKPETVPPRFSPKQCHPSVRSTSTYQDRATRRFVSGRDGGGAQNIEPRTVPPASPEGPTGAIRRFVSGRFGQEARNSATRQFAPPIWCHPPVWRRQMQAWCHPPIRGAEVASSRRTCPVRPLWLPPGPHQPPLTVLAGDPERKASRLKKLSSPTRY